jgi:hypothetical protein
MLWPRRRVRDMMGSELLTGPVRRGPAATKCPIVAAALICTLGGCKSRDANVSPAVPEVRRLSSTDVATQSPLAQQEIVVAALWSRELLHFIHPRDGGSRRILLANNAWTSGFPKMIEGAIPIVLVDGRGKSGPVVDVNRVEVRGDRATVEVRLTAEGVSGEIFVSRDLTGWRSTGARLVER